eukprot:2318644-Amphidinium_carterae.1
MTSWLNTCWTEAVNNYNQREREILDVYEGATKQDLPRVPTELHQHHHRVPSSTTATKLLARGHAGCKGELLRMPKLLLEVRANCHT